MQGTNTCCVYGCGARVKPIFHFPHPNRGLDRFNEWVKAAQNPKFSTLTNDQIYRRGYVCFQHFRPEDFIFGTKKLCQTAVPSILPPRNNTIPSMGSGIDVTHVQLETIDLNFTTPKRECAYFKLNSTPRERATPSRNVLLTPITQSSKESIRVRQLDWTTEHEHEVPTAGPSGLQNVPRLGQSPQRRKSAIYITEKPEDESNLQMVEEAEILHNLHLFDSRFIDVPETDLTISYSSDISTVVEDSNTLASQPYRIPIHNTDKQNLETDASLLSVQDECSPVMTNSSVVANIYKSTAGNQISDKVIRDTNHILESENLKIQNLQIDHEEEVVFDSEVLEPVVEDVEESHNSPRSIFGEKALLKTPLTKPYFRSVKSYLKDCDRMTEVCRICFCSLDDKEVIKLYEDTPQQDSTQIKNMLKIVLPDLDLEIYPNSVICTKCVELLLYSYQLKEKWLLTEEKLEKLIEKKKGVVSSAADLVIIGKLLIDKKMQNCGDIVNNDDAYTAQPHLDDRTRKNMTDSILENLLQHQEKSAPVSVFYGELDLNNKNKNSIRQKAYQSLQQKNKINREKKMSRVGPFMCEQCGHMVMSLKSLKRHLVNHSNPKERKKRQFIERKFMCEICGQLFISPNNLQRHASKHAEYTCSFCNRIFNHQFQLKNHIKCKHVRNCYQCHLCGKQVSYARSLQLHMQLHYPKPKRQVCHICDKRFRYPCNLRKHLRSHVRDKLLRCEHCGRLLKHEVSLRKHIEIYHMNQGRNVCEFCNKPYWKKCDLDKHKIRCHGGGFAIKESIEQNDDEVIFNEEIDPNNESCYVEHED